jgi:CHAT domain-containing protein
MMLLPAAARRWRSKAGLPATVLVGLLLCGAGAAAQTPADAAGAAAAAGAPESRARGEDDIEQAILDAVRVTREAHGAASEQHVIALRKLADHYWSRRRLNDALAAWYRVLAASEAVEGPDGFAVSRALQNLATIHSANREPAKGIPLLERALAIRERRLGPDHPDVATVVVNLGAALRQSGRYGEALPLLNRALAIRLDKLGPDHPDVAWALVYKGRLFEEVGQSAEALAQYERALAIRRKAFGPTHATIGQVLRNIAAVHEAQGDYAPALAVFEQVLSIDEATLAADHPFVADTLGQLARVQRLRGQYARALTLLDRALAIDLKANGPDHASVAGRLGGQAAVYRAMGQAEAALALDRRALAIEERTAGARSLLVATRLRAMAASLERLGRRDEARQAIDRALMVDRELLGPEHRNVASGQMRLASLLAAEGQPRQGLAVATEAVALSQRLLGEHHPEVAEQLGQLGELHLQAGSGEQALELFARAERIAGVAGAPEALWRAQDHLRRLHGTQGRRQLAIFWGKQSVNTIQGLRVGLSGLQRDLQQGFLADKRPVYTGLADLLIDAGRLAEAQQVLAMLKDEELHDFLRRDGGEDTRGSRAAFIGSAERNAESRWSTLNAQLAALGRERGELLRKAKLGLDEPQQRRLSEVETSLVEGNRRYDDFVTGLGHEFATEAAARQRELGARQLDNLVTLQDTLREVGGDTVLLHYVVAERRVAIIVTTSEVQVARESTITPVALNRLVHAMRSALQARGDVSGPARALYRVLIEPVLADLEQAGARKLALSLDGALRYVPFAALHDGRQYLVERFGLSVYTEAARGNLARRPRAEWAMTGLGLTRAVAGFDALPAVREELEGIRGGVLPGEVYLDDQFTAQRLTEALARQVPVLHIASHFSFRPGTDADSFLVLGDGGRLTLQEMRERRLRFGGVELLTLSACDTAMGGGRSENGAEVEGFGALAQRQGAQAVLATLWPVADQSTGRFMQQLYRTRQAAGAGGRPDSSKVQALRQTQLDFLKTPRYAHPYYWAPFILMGNWL